MKNERIREQLKQDLIKIKKLGIKLNEWIEIDDDTYHNSPGISASGLKDIKRKCPAYWRYKKDNYIPNEKSDALVAGSAAHKFILEPESFKDEYIVAPTSDKRKKEWKAFMANMSDEDSKKTVLRKSTMDMLIGIKESLSRKKDDYGTNLYDDIIHSKKSLREKAIFTIDPKRGILLKIKVDIVFNDTFLDLKSTKDATVSSFMKDAATMSYDIQAAFYLKVASLAGKKPRGFGFIGVEKEPPYLSNALLMTKRDITLGTVVMEKVLSEYSSCLSTGIWYGPNGIDKSTGIEPLLIEAEMPKWHQYEIEEMVGFSI